MRITLSIAGTSYTFVDPAKAQAAVDGLRAGAARHTAKAAACERDAAKLQAALDKGLAEDKAKAHAKKMEKLRGDK